MTLTTAPPVTTTPATPTTPTRQSTGFSVFRRPPFRLELILLLLVVSTVAWRKGTYFSGGFDTVVLAKAALTLLAFATALLTPRPAGAWSRFRGAPVLWLVAYLAIASVGGLLNGDPLPSVVLACRVGLLAVTLLLTLLSFTWESVMSAMARSMLALAVFGGVTGAASLGETGRLYGGVPPLNANEICFLVSVPVVLTFWRCADARAAWFEYAALPPMLGLIWLTGARTGFAALLLALMVVILLVPRVPTSVVSAMALALPVTVYITFFTPLLSDFAARGDLASVTTLNSRTVAWTAALDYAQTTQERLFGSGLALKEIPVSAMYRDQQILDSSWISALVQSGYVGTTVLVLFVLATFWTALRVTRRLRPVVIALLVMVTTVSLLESGLFDTTPSFTVFFTLAVFAHRVPAPGGTT
jgi:hypothetical protein